MEVSTAVQIGAMLIFAAMGVDAVVSLVRDALHDEVLECPRLEALKEEGEERDEIF